MALYTLQGYFITGRSLAVFLKLGQPQVPSLKNSQNYSRPKVFEVDTRKTSEFIFFCIFSNFDIPPLCFWVYCIFNYFFHLLFGHHHDCTWFRHTEARFFFCAEIFLNSSSTAWLWPSENDLRSIFLNLMVRLFGHTIPSDLMRKLRQPRFRHKRRKTEWC